MVGVEPEGNRGGPVGGMIARLRVEALSRTLLIAAPIGGIAAVAAILDELRLGEPGWAAFYAVLFLALLIALFAARPDGKVRPLLLLFPIYLLACSELWEGGAASLADMVMLVFVVFAGAFLGSWAGVIALGLSVVTFIGFAAAYINGAIPVVDPRQEDATTIFTWATLIPTYTLFSSGLLVLLRLLVKSLEDSASAAARTAETLTQVMDLVPHSIYAKDEDSRFIFVNQSSAELMGTTPDDAVGKTQLELSPNPEEGEAFTREDRAIVDSGEGIYHDERTWTGPDGAEYIHDVTKLPFRNPETGAPAILGISLDVTERRKAERERLLLEDQLRHAQKMDAVGQLAGGVAHDFNNLLQVILGNIEMARMNADYPGRVQDSLEEIAEASDRARDLVSRLLTFSRKQDFTPRPVELGTIVERSTRMIERLIGSNIEMMVERAADELPVLADSGQIEQVLVNLCVNARDAMPHGGRIIIRTSAKRLSAEEAETIVDALEGPYTVLSVSDTGCGIPEGIQDRVAEPFFTTKAVGEGTGLGLATVYGITKRHNGYLELESHENVGTTFRIHIPAAENQGWDDVEEAPPSPAELTGTESILLAEDNDQIRQLTTLILERNGYTVCSAANGLEAIRLFRERPESFDIAVLDVIMPECSGKDVYDAIRAISQLPVVFASGHGFEVLERHNLPRNGQLVRKPYSSLELLTAVRSALEGARSGKSPR